MMRDKVAEAQKIMQDEVERHRLRTEEIEREFK